MARHMVDVEAIAAWGTNEVLLHILFWASVAMLVGIGGYVVDYECYLSKRLSQ